MRTEAYGGIPVSWTTHLWRPDELAGLLTAAGLDIVADLRLPPVPSSAPASSSPPAAPPDHRPPAARAACRLRFAASLARAGAAQSKPVVPSVCSRRMSKWPACRADSSIMCT